MLNKHRFGDTNTHIAKTDTKSAKTTSNSHPSLALGFTIIELLIVIVIIAILVAITAVSYNGLTKNAKEAALKSDLKQAATEVELKKAKDGTPPSDYSFLSPSKNGTFTLSSESKQGYWCLTITPNSPNKLSISSFTITSDSGVVQQGACPSPNIQSITRDTCPEQRTKVKDARDNHTYWIQKLADGNCWMLTNLAYAGGGNNTYNDVINQGDGTNNTLSGPDNDGTVTYTKAKYYIPPNANPTLEPQDPSTSTNGGMTNPQYGYLYNFCAALGAQTTTAACANADTPTPNTTINICPDGWRLPTAERDATGLNLTSSEFADLNNIINGGSTTSDAGLIADPWMGQRSGHWGDGFGNLGIVGYYWTSSLRTLSQGYILYFNANTNSVMVSGVTKQNGRAVRCVAE